MVLTKSELIASLQNEVRILSHLISKVDRDKLDYRPSPKQRSTAELLQYLGMMGPTIVRYAVAETPDFSVWTTAAQEAESRTFEETIAVIQGQSDEYAALLSDLSDEDWRVEVRGFDGRNVPRGVFIVNAVLCGCAAYRTQLFLYLKASGRADLSTMNLWGGVDAPVEAVTT